MPSPSLLRTLPGHGKSISLYSRSIGPGCPDSSVSLLLSLPPPYLHVTLLSFVSGTSRPCQPGPCATPVTQLVPGSHCRAEPGWVEYATFPICDPRIPLRDVRLQLFLCVDYEYEARVPEWQHRSGEEVRPAGLSTGVLASPLRAQEWGPAC